MHVWIKIKKLISIQEFQLIFNSFQLNFNNTRMYKHTVKYLIYQISRLNNHKTSNHIILMRKIFIISAARPKYMKIDPVLKVPSGC